MKATGIVRRIDELGRVVIPKEIRRTLRIREGDPSQITLARWERFCFAMGDFLCLHEASKGDTCCRILYQMLRNTRRRIRNFSFSSGSNAISHPPMLGRPEEKILIFQLITRFDLLFSGNDSVTDPFAPHILHLFSLCIGFLIEPFLKQNIPPIILQK